MLFLGNTGYPPLLAHIEDAPPVRSIIGHENFLQRPAVQTVGTRNALVPGQRLAKCVASDLSPAGLVVVSGLTRGIEAGARSGSLITVRMSLKQRRECSPLPERRPIPDRPTPTI
jgi:DNA processing protein